MLRNHIVRLIAKNVSKHTFHSHKGSPIEKADCVVIGAGVVGLAIARQLAVYGREVLVLDSAPKFGTVTSSRNSEVIHAGIYYPTHSLKAKLCVKGKKMMYEYCQSNGIPHRQLGKLIVATNSLQIPTLEKLQRAGFSNGVTDLEMLDADRVGKMEPELQCVKALWSPSTGIVDSHSFMLTLLAESEGHNATFSFNTSVFGGNISNDCIYLHTCETKDSLKLAEYPDIPTALTLACKTVINSAGLSAPFLVSHFHGFPSESIPKAFFARGCYFTLSQASVPFSHLIYPVPEDGGLGVHVTIDISGQVKFGPDIEWIDNVDEACSFLNMFDYSVDETRAEKFYPEIRKYYPNLKNGALSPAYSGIRPKLSGKGQPPADFVIQGREAHGVPGLVNLFGIESPGLTASMAIAEMVSSMVLKEAS